MHWVQPSRIRMSTSVVASDSASNTAFVVACFSIIHQVEVEEYNVYSRVFCSKTSKSLLAF